MDRSTKGDLLKTVEQQKEQLHRYETRLRDVVKAYKGLVKEKEALEASFQALSSSKQASSSPDGDDASKEVPDPGSVEPETIAEPLENQEKDGEQVSSEVNQLRKQVNTLSASIATLTQEKGKMEAKYLAEKKLYKQENEEIVAQLTTANNQQEEKIATLESSVLDWKTRLRTCQYEREKDQTDHAVMLRELQKLLAEERLAKEHVEHQYEEARQTLQEKQNTPDVSEHYEKKIHDMSNKLEAVKRRLKIAEEQSNQPSPLLLSLQEEMAEVKVIFFNNLL